MRKFYYSRILLVTEFVTFQRKHGWESESMFYTRVFLLSGSEYSYWKCKNCKLQRTRWGRIHSLHGLHPCLGFSKTKYSEKLHDSQNWKVECLQIFSSLMIIQITSGGRTRYSRSLLGAEGATWYIKPSPTLLWVPNFTSENNSVSEEKYQWQCFFTWPLSGSACWGRLESGVRQCGGAEI